MQAITIKHKDREFFGEFDRVDILSCHHSDTYVFSIKKYVGFLEIDDDCELSLDGGINFHNLKVNSISIDYQSLGCKIGFWTQTKPFHGFIINDL